MIEYQDQYDSYFCDLVSDYVKNVDELLSYYRPVLLLLYFIDYSNDLILSVQCYMKHGQLPF
jgi:hypothetical protein